MVVEDDAEQTAAGAHEAEDVPLLLLLPCCAASPQPSELACGAAHRRMLVGRQGILD